VMSAKRILVVDDEIHIVHIVAIKLRNNGFEVITAENGAEAFKIACEKKPDVIVTDFQMPEMTGLEMVQALRQRQDMTDVPVIMLTARGFAIDDSQKQQLRISECLSKPFSPKQLLRTVEDVLHQTAVM
jgi:two-component system alkaline phosphatase synthesis response regulator PhoP